MEQIKAPVAVRLPWLLAALVASGCAGNEPRPVVDAELATARASIEQAERANAQQWAPNELATARENLRRAEEALAEREMELAARFATRAELDAQLAAATAGNREMQAAVEELQTTIETLRQETARGPAASPADPAAPGAPARPARPGGALPPQ